MKYISMLVLTEVNVQGRSPKEMIFDPIDINIFAVLTTAMEAGFVNRIVRVSKNRSKVMLEIDAGTLSVR